MPYDIAPGFVKCFIPNASFEGRTIQRQRQTFQVLFSLFEYDISLLFRHQIHFVYKAKDFCIWRILHFSINESAQIERNKKNI